MQLASLTEESLPAAVALIGTLGLGRHLDEPFIRRLTLEDRTAPPELLLTAEERGELVGVAFGALRQGQGMVQLLGVRADCRRQGIATALLDTLEQRLWARGVRRIAVEGSSPGYFFPGVELSCTAAISLLEGRGYSIDRNTRVDMLVDLASAPLDTAEDVARLAAEGIMLRQAQPEEVEPAAAFALQHFSPSWEAEVRSAGQWPQPPLYLAWQGDEVVAFAAHEVTGRARFGPTGTRPDLRRRGIGAALLRMCLAALRDRGETEAEIVWAGPVGFYARAVGARIHRAFWALRKDNS